MTRSIGSVIEQSFQDWELIIIDDGSTDHTKEVVNSFNDPRIQYFYQENSERSAARNKGIDQANSDWVCFLDSDDEYLPEHLEVIYKCLMSKDSARFILTGSIIKNKNSQIKHPLIKMDANVLVEIATKFVLMNSICIDKKILKQEQFNETYKIWEDTHLWLRIAAQYPVYQIEEYTTIQNIHEQGTVVQGMKKIRLIEVAQYVSAIQDLRDKHTALFECKLPMNYFNHYIDSKYRMYLYQARQNKQLNVALAIWFRAWVHQSSWYLVSELPKIGLNYLNIGIHER